MSYAINMAQNCSQGTRRMQCDTVSTTDLIMKACSHNSIALTAFAQAVTTSATVLAAPPSFLLAWSEYYWSAHCAARQADAL